jgi:hypothetical protein
MLEPIVSYKTAMLLKQRGFDEICHLVYCDDIIHNGKSLSFDEELDLRDEGRENEIEYVAGGRLSNMSGTKNSCDYISETVCTAPSQSIAAKWLREEYGIVVLIRIAYRNNDVEYTYTVINTKTRESHDSADYFRKYESAYDFGIRYALEKYVN